MNEPFRPPAVRRPHALAAALAILVVGSGLAADPKPPASAPAVAPAGQMASFDAFRMIGERNIFNPNRVGRSRASDAPLPRVDTISFVGTMNYEKGLFAFFDGSERNYRKALKEGGTIGQYTVTRITADSVELMRDKKPIALRVADQLRRPEGGDWSLVAGEAARNDPRLAETSGANSADAGTDTSATPPIPAGASDLERRLMEQRQKTIKP